MARLIPQKQIEEINIFKDSISVANSVFISGSLYVSHRFQGRKTRASNRVH